VVNINTLWLLPPDTGASSRCYSEAGVPQPCPVTAGAEGTGSRRALALPGEGWAGWGPAPRSPRCRALASLVLEAPLEEDVGAWLAASQLSPWP